MPTSYYQAIPHVLSMVLSEKPESILDLGVGFGKYGMLCREMLEVPYERYRPEEWKTRIDGVEGFPEYKTPVYDYVYNRVHFGRIEEVIDGLPDYDVVLLVDVLEHFTKEAGQALIPRLRRHAKKALVISTPLRFLPQGEFLGNDLEHHKSAWSPEEFAPYQAEVMRLPIADQGALLVKVRPTAADRLAQAAEGMALAERVALAADAWAQGAKDVKKVLAEWYNAQPEGFPVPGLWALAEAASEEGQTDVAGGLLLQAFQQHPSAKAREKLLVFARTQSPERLPALQALVKAKGF